MTNLPGRLMRKIHLRASLGIGIGIVLFFMLVSIFASLISPYDPTAQNLLATLQTPSLTHLFGTDALGRDILSRVIHGTSFELIVVLPAVTTGILLALPAGLLAGYRGGWIDRIVSWISDSVLTFPAMVLAIVLVAVLGSGFFTLILAIVATQAPQMVRYIRGFTVQVRSADYVMAARASGSKASSILIRHVLPNILGPIMVILSLFASEALLIIAALGFLGIGAQPPAPEWGTMLSEGRIDFLAAPHVMLFPGIAIALLILGFNLLGDGLRDFLDKRS